MAVDMNWTHPMYWTYKGVDFTMPGTGGEDCVNYLPLTQRLLETLLACLIATIEIVYAYPRLTLPGHIHKEKESKLKRILLVLVCLTFGTELGYKLASEQLIWILNPCHVVTMVQIYLLAAPPSKLVTAVFRLHMYSFHGAILAIFLPVTNTRLLPCETPVYYVQHSLMILVPGILARLGGPYTLESLSDFNWAFAAGGILFVMFFVPVHFCAYVSHVNLNNMLCPAISDPFYGPYYRLAAMTHQFLLIIVHGKVYAAITKAVIRPMGEQVDCTDVNGHAKAQ